MWRPGRAPRVPGKALRPQEPLEAKAEVGEPRPASSPQKVAVGAVQTPGIGSSLLLRWSRCLARREGGLEQLVELYCMLM